MEKLTNNTIIKTYCLRHCCQGTPKRAVHAEGGAVSINTKVKSEDTENTDARNHRHVSRMRQDGTAEPVSRDQINSQARTRTGKYYFSLFG